MNATGAGAGCGLPAPAARRALRRSIALILIAGACHARPAATGVELAELSLEQLSDLVVTTVSRHAESLANAPAAIFVITAEDIRSSGARSLPEALRLAPNLQVARADTNQYAISARGFNNVLANKMLVLIDGRTIYTPLFSGVFWEAQDTLLEDIDRIEVISGPGTTLWGANAVNGVINVITRNARDTRGTLASIGGGNRESGGGARHGGALDDGGVPGAGGSYRVYGTYYDREHSTLASGIPVRDGSWHGQAGFRVDVPRGTDAFTLQGDVYRASLDLVPEARSISGANLLARWTRELGEGGNLVVQAYYDRTQRDHPGIFGETLDTFDVEFQHLLAPIGRNVLLWGAGARYAQDSVTNSPSLAFLPADRTLRASHVFAQDQYAFSDDLDLIVGAKVETNSYTGANFLPNLRIAWRPPGAGLLWAAVSKAARAPSRIDRDYHVPGKPPYLIAGGGDFQSEIATVYELGYRAQPWASLSFTINGFHYDYDRLRSLRPTSGGYILANDIEGTSTGAEAWATWVPASNVRIYGGVVTMRQRLRVKPGATDAGGLAAQGNDPELTWMLRGSWDVAADWEVDATVRHVGSLPSPVVPAYTAVDARVGYKVTPNVELSLTVSNAFDPGHAEWGSATSRVEFERAYFVNVLWKL